MNQPGFETETAGGFLFKGKPLVFLALAWLAGLLLGWNIYPEGFSPLWILAPAFGFFAYACVSRRGRLVASCLAVLFLGFAWIRIRMPAWFGDDAYTGESYRWQGTAEEVSGDEDACEIILTDVRIKADGTVIPLSGKLLLIVEDPEEEYGVGDVVAYNGITSAPCVRQLGGTYDEQTYSLTQGIRFLADAGEDAVTREGQGNILWTKRITGFLQDRIRTATKSAFYWNEAALAQALTIGDTGAMSYTLRTSFENLGLSHVLSISGLHVVILLAVVAWICEKLRVPPTLQKALEAFLLGFYL